MTLTESIESEAEAVLAVIGGQDIVNIREPSPVTEICGRMPVAAASGMQAASLVVAAALRSAAPIIRDTDEVINGAVLLTTVVLGRSLETVRDADTLVSSESQLHADTSNSLH